MSCLGLLVLCVAIGVGGYFAFRSGAITPQSALKFYLNASGQGPAQIEVDNFRDDAIIVTLKQAGTPTSSSQDFFGTGRSSSLNAFDVKLFHVPNPGKYRVEFLTDKEGTALGSCNLSVRGGDQYQFVTLPDKIVVNRANSPSSVGTDFVVSASSLCR